MRRRRLDVLLISISLLVGTAAITASLAVPIILLLRLDDRQLNRWSEIGQALSPVGIILNLQKVAYETHTIELAELRGALRYLMTSRDMYMFWQKVRTARLQVTGGDEGEDFFTFEVDHAFNDSNPLPRRSTHILREALAVWRHRLKI